MRKIIPLFPLNLVVFPKSKYPLYIFEDRYKKLVRKCWEEESGFIIVAMIGKEPAKIGCYVSVNQIVRTHKNGEMDIIVQGHERYRIIESKIHTNGYLIGSVEALDDVETTINPELVDKLQYKFENLLDKIDFKLEEAFWKSFNTADNKSFKLAEKSGLSLEQQQTILSLNNENQRLFFLLEHFDKMEKHISDNLVVKKLVMSDGYIN